jgi:curved DNA-binding protein CbpA
MGASLSETYQGYLVEDKDEYMDEQSASRRSLKDTQKRRKKQNDNRSENQQTKYQSEPESFVKKSRLETHIEEKPRSKSQPRSRCDEDFDNVTTISKASINPYRVLGLSQGATPREVYDSYKQRRKETHPDAVGGSEKAFRDVGNAYRRLRAELKRQEARKERRKSSNGTEHRSEKQDNKYSSKKQSKSRRRGHDSDDDEDNNIDKRRQSIDGRLKDHRALVQNLFANDAKEQAQKMSSNSSVSSIGQVTSLQQAIYSQSRALMALSLVPIEAGATNINEKNKTIQNNCFYLSLAASYLSGAGAFETDPTAVYYKSTGKSNGKKSSMASDGSVMSTQTLDMAIASLPSAEKSLTMSLALQLKRAIEAAVVLVHPNWAADGVVGEEVQAFSGKHFLFVT